MYKSLLYFSSLLLFISVSSTAKAETASVVINEIGAYEKSGYEWIEIFNNGTSAVDLSGWKFAEDFSSTKLNGTAHKLKAIQNDFILEPLAYALIVQDAEKFKELYSNYSGTLIDSAWGSLKESGEKIELRDAEANVIESFVYLPCPNTSLERNDPALSDYTENNWQEHSANNSLGERNSNYLGQELPAEEPALKPPTETPSPPPSSPIDADNYLGKIVINEVYPAPADSNLQDEFVELKNLSDVSINLKDWVVQDLSKKHKIKQDAIISPHNFLTLEKSITKIALNNSGFEKIEIFDAEGDLIDALTYLDPLKEAALARTSKSSFAWTKLLTPGAENAFKQENHAPQPQILVSKQKVIVDEEIIFSASQSSDPDRDPLEFSWDLAGETQKNGAVIKYRFKTPDIKLVNLTVSDGELESQAMINIEVLEEAIEETAEEADGEAEEEAEELVEQEDEINDIDVSDLSDIPDLDADLIITEIMPNPDGRDDNEWIEIYNQEEEDVKLFQWILDDSLSSIGQYVFPEEAEIKAKSYLVINKAQFKFALNNDYDEARLVNPQAEVVSGISYNKTYSGQSYALNNQEEWQWTEKLTPGEENIFENKKAEDQQQEQSLKITQTAVLRSSSSFALLNSLAEVRNYQKGDKVKVKGNVSVLPDIFSSRFFYIFEPEANAGLQVYSYYSDFPELKIGDEIQVQGELSQAYGEQRIKTKNKNDITILSFSNSLDPFKLQPRDWDDALVGSLLILSGEVIEIKSKYFYLWSDEQEVQVELRGVGSLMSLGVGDLAEVFGILKKAKDGFKLWPRSSDDIKLIKKAQAQILENKQALEIPQGNIRKTWEKYLTVTVWAGVVVVAVLFGRAIRRRQVKIEQ